MLGAPEKVAYNFKTLAQLHCFLHLEKHDVMSEKILCATRCGCYDFYLFFKSATVELSELLLAKKKSSLPETLVPFE